MRFRSLAARAHLIGGVRSIGSFVTNTQERNPTRHQSEDQHGKKQVFVELETSLKERRQPNPILVHNIDN